MVSTCRFIDVPSGVVFCFAHDLGWRPRPLGLFLKHEQLVHAITYDQLVIEVPPDAYVGLRPDFVSVPGLTPPPRWLCADHRRHEQAILGLLADMCPDRATFAMIEHCASAAIRRLRYRQRSLDHALRNLMHRRLIIDGPLGYQITGAGLLRSYLDRGSNATALAAGRL